MWKLLDTGVASAEENMRLDAQLLEDLDPKGAALLHLYAWAQPSVTYGYFITPEKFLHMQRMQREGVFSAKRPTGGGIVFHVSDLAFSVLVPAQHSGFSENTLDNYRYVNEKVLKAVKNLLQENSMDLLPIDPIATGESCKSFCMAKPTIFDVMIQGKKIAGAAQRKRKQGFLHQGSISIALPDLSFLENVVRDPSTVEAMQLHTHTLLPRGYAKQQLEEMRYQLRQHIQKVFLQE